MNGILLGDDDAVASWAWKTYNLYPLSYIRALGVLRDDKLVGAAIFSHYNSCDAHLSYYGVNTLTGGIIKCLAHIAIDDLNLSRITLVIPKKSRRLLKSVLKLGFKVEGIQRCFFGRQDSIRNTGVRLVLFRDQIEAFVHKNNKEALSC